MPTLSVIYNDETADFSLEKVDRTKVHGYVETEVYDEDGIICELATLANDGQTIVPKGGTGSVYLSADGTWLDRKDLTPILDDGSPVQPVPSTFDSPVTLDTEATPDDILACDIRLVYQLDSEATPNKLFARLNDGAIFSLPFSWRGGLSADPAFILLGTSGHVYLLVGTPLDLEYLTFQASADVLADEEDTEQDLFDLDLF